GIFSQYGTRVPFLIAAGLSFLNWLYGYFILPESLSKRQRRRFEWKRANAAGSLLHLKRYKTVWGLILAFLLLYIAGHALQSTWTFYTMLKFDWNEAWVGYSLGAFGLLIAIVQGVLIRAIIPKTGQKNAVYIGLTLYIIGFVLFAFASDGWMMFAFMIPYCLGGIAAPALQGIISSGVKSNEQGELQGALTSLISITSIIGPLIMTYLFAFFTRPDASVYFPGAPFLMGAVLTALSIFLAAHSLSKDKKR